MASNSENPESIIDEFPRAIFDSLPGVFYLLDKDWNLILWNSNLEEISGYSSEELKTMKPVNFFAEKDRENVAAKIEEVATKGSEGAEASFLLKNGDEIPYYFTATRFSQNGETYFAGMGIDISERKLAETRIVADEKRLSNAQRLANIGDWEWDLKTNTIIWSDEMYRICGVDPDLFKPSPNSFAELAHSEDAQMISAGALRSNMKINRLDTECRIIDQATGKTKYTHVRAEVELSTDGNPVRLTGTLQDITERKKTDKMLRRALKESSKRRREITAMLEASRAVIEYKEFEQAARSIFDICRDQTNANSGYVALLSRDGSENEVIFLESGGLPCNVDDSLPMPTRGLRAEVYKTGRAIYDNNFPNSKYYGLLPKGHVELKNVMFAPLNIKGKTVGLLGLANKPDDFTDNDARLASVLGEMTAIALMNDWTFDSLEKSEIKYRSLTQSATDAIISADNKGRITSWNRGAEKLFGYTEDEASGQSITALMPEKYRQKHKNAMERYLKTGKPNVIGTTVEMSGLKKTGIEFPLELSLSSWKTKEGDFFTGIIRDITKRKIAEENAFIANMKTQSYAERLSVLHKIGLSLNRETDIKRLLKTVLEGAAHLTSAGVGVMTLIEDGGSRIILKHYAPWYNQRCQIDETLPSLHKRVSSLISQGSDSARINKDKKLDNLPEDHLVLKGLLIGALKDTKGRIKGHFMLSEKKNGGDFTAEDEEIISLLAAQSSVALTSTENFEREHVVAESLQDALLPDVPVREDIEVGLMYVSSGPYGKIGGDFYDFIEIDNSRTAVVVGDFSGKGLTAATYTAMIKYMLRAYFSEELSPGECLTRLNSEVYKTIPADKFVTVAFSVIDTQAATITHASAGHPAPLFCLEDSARTMPIEQSVPLGVFKDHKYSSFEEVFTGACSIVLYTDGLLDARPEEGDPFGEKRLTDNIEGRCHVPPQQLAKDVIKAALGYSENSLKDDIALIIIRLNQSNTCNSA